MGTVDRRQRLATLADCFDRSVPAVVFKVGRYPMVQGELGVIRSLGRLGSPFHAVVERCTGARRSLSLPAGTVVWPTTGSEPIGELVEGLVAIGRQVGERSVLL